MHEARLEVRDEAAGIKVRLIDVSGGERLVAEEDAGDGLANGFADLLGQGGARITAASLAATYAGEKTLVEAPNFGRYLFRLLTPGAIAAEWKQLRATHNKVGLTTLLELGPASWQHLPWELLYADNMFAFHHQRHALGLRMPGGALTPATPRWPLRMLVLVGCGPEDRIAPKAEVELLAIRRAICAFSLRIDLTVKRAPFSKLEAGKAIGKLRPHLLHFIGHGTTDDGGTLTLTDAGGPTAWPHAEIAAVLSQLQPDEVPRLALINACESANPGVSVATAFADIGCPAVIAMQGDILGIEAATFSKAFYEALAELGMGRVAQAYCRALSALAMGRLDQRVWSLPRIFYQETAGGVFPPAGNDGGFDQAATGFTDLPELKPFVNHDDRRFEIYQQAGSWLDAPEPGFRALLIRGPEKSGKSWLLQAIVYAASLRGYHAVYRDFDGRNFELEDFLNTLRLGITDGSKFLSGPLWTGGALPDPLAAPDPAAVAAAGNEDQKLPQVQRFAEELKKLGAAQPLLIAFDHVAKLRTCWKYLRGPLFEAATKGSRPGGLGAGVRFVVAEKIDEVNDFGLDALAAKKIELGDLPAQSFEDYVTQYCLHRLADDGTYEEKLKEYRATIEVLAENRRKSQRPWKLNQLSSIFEMIGVG